MFYYREATAHGPTVPSSKCNFLCIKIMILPSIKKKKKDS